MSSPIIPYSSGTSPAAVVLNQITDIKNGLLTTDLNANGYSIRNASLSAPATIFVDPVNGTDSGVVAGTRGTTLPVATMTRAIVLAQDGDTIELRGNLTAGATINKSVRINGNGAKITVPEGSVATIIISADDVEISNLELFASRVASDATPNNGNIEVFGKRVTLRGVHIHDGVGYGVRLVGDVSGLRILDSRIENCTQGVFLDAVTAVIKDVLVSGNRIHNNRGAGGIRLNNLHPSADRLTNTRGFRVEGNDVRDNGALGIELWGGHNEFTVTGNTVSGSDFGISIDHCMSGVVSGNSVTNCNYIGIEAAASHDVAITGNTVDGRNNNGEPILGNGVSISTLNDSISGVSVVGNIIRYIRAGGVGVGVGGNVTGAEFITITGNTIVGSVPILAAIALKEARDCLIASNNISLVGTLGTAPAVAEAIALDAGNYGLQRVTIFGNVIRFTGTLLRAISLIDTQSKGADTIRILNNLTPPGAYYVNWTLFIFPFAFIPTNVVQQGNQPSISPSGTGELGWRNDERPTVSPIILNLPSGDPDNTVNRFVIGSGDGATRATHSIEWQGHYGLGLKDSTYGGIKGVYNFRTGAWDVDDGYYVAATKIVGGQGNAVPDATDAASAITQLNTLLARLRAHGLIA